MKKVLCIKITKNCKGLLTIGKEYEVFGQDDNCYQIYDDELELCFYDKKHFKHIEKNETPTNPTHYQTKIQPIEYIEANNLGFHEGNVIKYITRYKDKNGIEDLEKAKTYIEMLINKLKKEQK